MTISVLAISTFLWVFTAIDDILYHTPFYFGQMCGEQGLPFISRGFCRIVYNYYYSLDARTVDSGVMATVFLVVSSISLVVLWYRHLGVPRAVLRTLLVVVPLEVIAFEVCVYFFLNYWWTVHATEFLTGTPFTNEVIFLFAAIALGLGLSIELVVLRRPRIVTVHRKGR